MSARYALGLWGCLLLLYAAPDTVVAQRLDAPGGSGATLFAANPFNSDPPDAERPVTSRSMAARPVGGSGAFRVPPKPTPDRDRWLAMDKAKHVGGSMLLTLSAQYVLVVKGDRSRNDALPVSAASAFSVGLAKEVYDRYAGPTQVFSAKDLVADALGIVVGVLVIVV